jgi:small-conductance mechanosensitive channel
MYAQDSGEPATHELVTQEPEALKETPLEEIGEIEDAALGFVESLSQYSLLLRLGIAAGIVLLQFVLIRVSWSLFAKLDIWIKDKGKRLLKPITFKKLQLLSTKQILGMVFFVTRILKYVVSIFQLYLTLPVIFGLFEPTRGLSKRLFGYVLDPLKQAGLGILNYIPNLITIAVIVFLVRYAIRGVKFITTQIEHEKIHIAGFYADWAQPTFNILRILLYAFMIVVIYPYIPGSDSAAFQGVSVFIGLIFSLGSTSAIGNVVAGVVITYMRPFKIGDRVKIGEVTGFVVEKAATVTRLRTHKNEFVTFPNQAILGALITNYNFSAELSEGLILHTDVTMNYAVPWSTMYDILLGAAKKTPYVLDKPAPYVLQTGLEDYYARYELNIYVKEVSKAPLIFSELHKNLQDGFRAANIDLTAPKFEIRAPMPEQMEPGTVPGLEAWKNEGARK